MKIVIFVYDTNQEFYNTNMKICIKHIRKKTVVDILHGRDLNFHYQCEYIFNR